MAYILITGTNRGLGLALVTAYLDRGDHVFAACRKPPSAVKLQALAERCPDRLTILSLDVADEASIGQAAKAIGSQTKRLDLLINNAGIFPRGTTLSSIEVGTLLQTMHVNAIGPLMVARALVRLLEKSDHPVILNVSSDSGSLALKTTGGDYGYCASKAALNMLTRALAFDLQSRGIIVIALHPGWVRTDMGGRSAPLSPKNSALGILSLADRLTLSDCGRFLTWDGHELPW
jgi:NAD(P)-dependent dehydrogenase (short-subunit alcohol dehydrogenase family)